MNDKIDNASAGATFQARVQPWMVECFGPMIAGDREERNHRFLEEALELVQSTGCTASEAHQLVEYVFGRPVGEPAQEVGGVMVTLAALCLAHELDMHECGETELARIWTKVEAIRAKQAAKPKYSPLPVAQGPTSVAAMPAPADNESEWLDQFRKVDGAVAFHLIERHGADWGDCGRLMELFASARQAAPQQHEQSPNQNQELSDEQIKAIAKSVGMHVSHDGKYMRSTGTHGGMNVEDGIAFARAILATRQHAPVAPWSAVAESQTVTLNYSFASAVLGALFNGRAFNPEAFEQIKQAFAAIMSGDKAVPVDATALPGNAKARLIQVHDALCYDIGDTEPQIDPDMTDDEVRDEYPVFWAAKELATFIGDGPWDFQPPVSPITKETPQ